MSGDVRMQEFQDDKGRVIWVLWLANGSAETRSITLHQLPGKIHRADRMPLADGPAPEARIERVGQGIRLSIGPDPTYLIFESGNR